MKEQKKEKEGRKRDRRPRARTSPGDVWKMALTPFASGAEFASVGNDTKWVQSAVCTRMRIVFSWIRLELKTSVCREKCHCHVCCIRL